MTEHRTPSRNRLADVLGGKLVAVIQGASEETVGACLEAVSHSDPEGVEGALDRAAEAANAATGASVVAVVVTAALLGKTAEVVK